MYEYVWQNKYLTVDAKTIEEMIEFYEDALANLKLMQAAGITLSHGAQDDYATFITDSKELGDKFDFDLITGVDDE